MNNFEWVKECEKNYSLKFYINNRLVTLGRVTRERDCWSGYLTCDTSVGYPEYYTSLEPAILRLSKFFGVPLELYKDILAEEPSFIVQKSRDIIINGVRQGFRWIPSGKFLMGSPKNENERYSDEVQYEVILTKGYWLAETACTQALWEAVRGNNPSRFKGGQNPVENVSWADIIKFIEKLNNLEPMLNFRLPTEAEWEYACRAGTTTPFSFGENITPEQVNYDGNNPYRGGKKGNYRKKTVPVKSLPCNPWGLYEMHGNLWEWCANWYRESYSVDSVVNPVGPESGDDHVIRGGSWSNFGGSVRSACRYWHNHDYSSDFIGFRLVIDFKR